MKRLCLAVLLCLLAGKAAGTSFELEDPAQSVADAFKEMEAAESNTNIDTQQTGTPLTPIHISKNDYLKLFVGNYVNGFKEFDTRVIMIADSISVDIYYDPREQNSEQAEKLAKRFRIEIPEMLTDLHYRWASDVALVVSVHGKDRYDGY